MSANNNDHIPAEAEVVAELARESGRFNQDWYPNGSKLNVNIIRDGERVSAYSHEKHADEPYRARGESTVADVRSFVTLLGMDEHHGSTIFADEKRARLTAVVNFHGWRDHCVSLQLTHSDQLRRWMNANGKLYSQADFVEFIEDSLSDLIEPTAADMLELAQSFQATKSVEFDAGVRLASGAVQFRYHEDVQAKAGRAGEIEVPSTFMLAIPVWRGGARIHFQANLRYRIGRDGLQLGFKVLTLDDILS
ncbi:DUF2303 family protein, partial [Bacillus cereus]|uniref:DUF2303 family protein n=1 Tax=Bacillus cereus TaxID=1396 RepID=UPI00366B5BC7